MKNNQPLSDGDIQDSGLTLESECGVSLSQSETLLLHALEPLTSYYSKQSGGTSY